MAARLIVFDMDGTLLADRLIFVLADKFGFRKKLETIIEGSSPEYEKTRRIANELSLENGRISGEIKMPLGWGKAKEQCLKHSVYSATGL